MQDFRLLAPSENPFAGYMGSLWNRFMNYLAREYARNEVRATGKSFYGFEMFGRITVMSSVERDDINRKMPKGNKMHIAETLRHKVFHITPESLRKKNT